MYHPTLGAKIAVDATELIVLGPEWRDHPFGPTNMTAQAAEVRRMLTLRPDLKGTAPIEVQDRNPWAFLQCISNRQPAGGPSPEAERRARESFERDVEKEVALRLSAVRALQPPVERPVIDGERWVSMSNTWQPLPPAPSVGAAIVESEVAMSSGYCNTCGTRLTHPGVRCWPKCPDG